MINIKEILEKHNCYPDSQLQVKIADGKKGSIGERYNSAIREIIEEVLKEAANSARILEQELNPWDECEVKSEYLGTSFEVDKGTLNYLPYKYLIDELSIISVINKVKFD